MQSQLNGSMIPTLFKIKQSTVILNTQESKLFMKSVVKAMHNLKLCIKYIVKHINKTLSE